MVFGFGRDFDLWRVFERLHPDDEFKPMPPWRICRWLFSGPIMTNTGAATLAVDGLAAKSLKKLHDQDLESGDIEEDQIVVCVYNATDDTYEVVSNVPSSSSSQNFHYPVAVSDETTALTTGTAKVTFRMPAAVTLTEVRASLTTASSSGVVTVDINEGGTTILSTKLTIDANEKTSTSAATAAVISDTSLADDAEITIDIDGAGTGAAGLKIYLIGTLT